MKLRLGTRGSALALWQSRHIAARLAAAHAGLEVELVEIVSAGDRILDVPLWHVEGTGFFTAALEQALMAGHIDVAVHSYKDLPVESSAALVVAAIPSRGPVEDVLCARDGLTFERLPAGARVGTCSTRRMAQARLLRADLDLVPLRGNLPTRVARVGADLDAVILARAGLERLGLEHTITETFSTGVIMPAPAQGALAVQCRATEADVCRRLAVLDDPPSRRAVDAERALLHALGGGCSVPVGAIATALPAGIHLAAGVFGVRTPIAIRLAMTGADPVALGRLAAARLVEQGAGDILAECASAPVRAPA
ncbi:MAG: hydroxymethylbilane synthase [Vicinamibacterales bacterium]|jgi:hydroxymethylbilane synthase